MFSGIKSLFSKKPTDEHNGFDDEERKVEDHSSDVSRSSLRGNTTSGNELIATYLGNTSSTPPPPSYEEAFILPTVESKKQVSAYKEKRNEVKFLETATERKRFEELADLYSIIRTTECIEAAYSRDSITETEYSEVCLRLLSQFKTTESALKTAGTIESVDKFMQSYSIDCPRAFDRLVKAGVPATVLHSSHDSRGESIIVAETVQAFITAMDALKLELRAVDEIHPLLSELMSCINRVPKLPKEYEGTMKLNTWLTKLNAMRAVETIDENDARQLIFDLESSYSAFHKHLIAHGGNP